MSFRLNLQGLLIACGLGLLVGLFAVTFGEAQRSLYRLEISLAPDRPTEMQLFWDQGDDYRESASTRRQVSPQNQPQTVVFYLSPGPVTGFRLDPFNGPGRLTVGSAVVRDVSGAERTRLDVSSLKARYQITSLKPLGSRTEVVTSPTAHDPAIEWRLAEPLQLGFGPAEWWLLGGRYLLGTWLVAGLFLGVAFGPRGNTRTFGRRWVEFATEWPKIALTFATVVIWLGALASMPLATTTFLDASWQQALVWARLHNLQFGRDVIFTAGPWSWLFSLFYLGDLVGVKLAWEAFGKLLLAALLVHSTRDLPGARRAWTLLAFALVGGLLLDVWLMVLLTYVGLTTLLRRDATRSALIVALVVFTFMAQVKFTLTVLGGAIVGLGALAALWRGNWRRALALPAGFAGLFLVWWLAAGQNPIRILRWIEMSLEVSRGYSGAMSVEPTLPVLLAGVAVLAGLGGYLWRHLITTPADQRAERWPVIALAAGVTFVAWKHGFTRADGHVLGFFFVVLLLVLVLPAYLPARSRIWRVEALGAVCLLGVWLADDTILAKTPAILGGRIYASSEGIGRPTHFVPWWHDVTDGEQRRASLPKVRAEVGDDTIDFINAEQGWLMLNELAYQPRPVLQSYSVYTPELASRNLGWLQRDDRAAKYLLFDYLTIDGRYAAQDDALLIADLPRRYEAVLKERGLLLTHRIENPPPADGVPRDLLTRGVVGFGDRITIPTVPPEALWLKLMPLPTGLGRLRATLYKPAELRLIVREINGNETNHRLVVDAANEGFVIQPYLPDLASLEAFLTLEGPRRVQNIRVEPLPGEGEYWQSLTYELARLPELPLALGTGDANLVVQGGVANRPVVRLDLPFPPDLFEIDGHPAMLAHSPGRLEFAASDHARLFTGKFGLREGAYTGGAQTDGVTFEVRTGAKGKPTEDLLWSRRLEPVQVEADRGSQTFTINVPAGVTVALLTEPGPNANWDWAYWSQIEFQP